MTGRGGVLRFVASAFAVLCAFLVALPASAGEAGRVSGSSTIARASPSPGVELTLQASASHIRLGEPLGLTATVRSNRTPGGTIGIVSDLFGWIVASEPADTGGRLEILTSELPAGEHALTAIYTEAGATVESPTVTVTVLPPPPALTPDYGGAPSIVGQ